MHHDRVEPRRGRGRERVFRGRGVAAPSSRRRGRFHAINPDHQLVLRAHQPNARHHQQSLLTTEPDSLLTELQNDWGKTAQDQAAIAIQRTARCFLARCLMFELLSQKFQRRYDPVERKYYYVNTETNEMSYEKPLAVVLLAGSDADNVLKGNITGHPKDSQAAASAFRLRYAVPPDEAAKRIQRCCRAHVAMARVREIVRETYMKLFDEHTRSFCYFNTSTCQKSHDKPLFLRRNDALDLPIERFLYRKACCKICVGGAGAASDKSGTGIVGYFQGVLCVLSDSQTLPDEETASMCHLVCNYATDCLAFHVFLQGEKFFMPLHVPTLCPVEKLHIDQDGHPVKKLEQQVMLCHQFSLCAINETQFEAAARENIKALQFSINDRKYGCVNDSMRIDQELEVVGHPHGKLQTMVIRKLNRMVPSSVKPLRLEYDRTIESGTMGCGIFTRGGKLLGVQQFTSLRDPLPTQFCYIKPIVVAAIDQVTPKDPLLIACTLSSTAVSVYWHLPPNLVCVKALQVEFELQISACHPHHNDYYDHFERVYLGSRQIFTVDGLTPSGRYALRCRAFHSMGQSGWSSSARVITMPKPSLAWRIKYCRNIGDALQRLSHAPREGDPRLHVEVVSWLLQHVTQVEPSKRVDIEQEIWRHDGFQLVVEQLQRYEAHDDNAVVTLKLFVLLAANETARFHEYFSSLSMLEYFFGLMRRKYVQVAQGTERADAKVDDDEQEEEDDDDDKQVPRAKAFGQVVETITLAMSLVSSVSDADDSAKQKLVVCTLPKQNVDMDAENAFEQKLEPGEPKPVLDGLRGIGLICRMFQQTKWLAEDAQFTAEACVLFATITHQNDHGKDLLVSLQGLEILQQVLARFPKDARVLYWALVTLGNIGFVDKTVDHSDLETRMDKIHLVESIGDCNMTYLIEKNELEHELEKQMHRLETLQNTVIGHEMRNELDACDQLVTLLTKTLDAMKAHDVASAAEFALQVLMTEQQKLVREKSKRVAAKLMTRKLHAAFLKWVEVSDFVFQQGIMQRFLKSVRDTQLIAAFRRWEAVVVDMKKPKGVSGAISNGLAIDLNKKKRERYRQLVLQK